MNEKLIQDIFHIQSNLEREQKASSLDNAFLFFQLEYEHYYLPIFKQVIPDLMEHLSYSKKEKKEQYYSYIISDWIPLIEHQLKRQKLQNLANISICEYLVKDINMIVQAYEYKNDPEQKKEFILKFLKKKSGTIIKVLKEDFELGFKTISSIICPKVQFELIQCNKQIKEICHNNFKLMTEKERLYFLSNYFCYPATPDVDQYYLLWKGQPYLHIKFCREMLGDYYKNAKKFLKGKPQR